jgi:hypothetical protein
MLTGKTISFSVVATGVEPLAYQWSKDGSEIDGATSSALELADVSADNAGDYAVTVSNDAGSVTSDTVTLKVQDSPGGDAVTIKHLRSLVDDNREPSDTKTIFTAEGIVTTHTNMTGGSHSLFYFQDDTAGIAVYFRSGKSSHPKAGDKVRVSAPLGHFNGLLEFVPDAGNAMHLVKVVSSDNALPEPAKLDFMQSDDAAAMEALEGSLVVVSEVEIDSGGGSKFSGGANYTLTDADGMTFTLRIDSRIKSIIDQREVGIDTESFPVALRHSLRQSPDVILIGEMRDRETMEAAIAAAETGHLVLSTLHTVNATQTVERIIHFFPPHQHDLIRLQLSLVLSGVVCQRLVPFKEKAGRVPALELMINSPTIRELLREGRTHELANALRAGEHYGCCTFNQSLRSLYQADRISLEEALSYSDFPDELQLELRGVVKGSAMGDFDFEY